MMRLVWTEPAVADLQAIVDFIGRDSEVYAATVAERLFQGVEALERFPRMGKVVREVRRPSIREIVVEPYRIIYRIRQDRVEILAIVHGARDLLGVRPAPWRRA
jgi:addiction module RelE/StbE family toxin